MLNRHSEVRPPGISDCHQLIARIQPGGGGDAVSRCGRLKTPVRGCRRLVTLVQALCSPEVASAAARVPLAGTVLPLAAVVLGVRP